MPKFVPVKDSERPASEQLPDDEEFSKHRKFDAPHAIKRGWGVGEVGWGVNKTFGDEKDMSAQVIKHAEGANKMVRNEKGLWVKAKTLDLHSNDDSSYSGGGRGRGKGGISVIDHLLGKPLSNRDEYSHDQRRGDDSESEDSYEHRGRRPRSREPRDKRRDHTSRSRSRSRSRSIGKDRRSRSRSESRNRGRHNDKDRRKTRSRCRSRDRHSSRRNCSRSPSRSRSRKGRRYSRSRDKRTRSRSRSYSRPRQDNKHKLEKSASLEHSKSATAPGQQAGEEDAQVEITAVQVVNRFHEVYSYQSSNRLSEISELFEDSATIYSMKNEAMLLTGKSAIRGSFEKTKASRVEVSKRVFVKHSACPVTYVLDFHRPGTSPGLGNMQKCTVLLYECLQAKITAIYGMVDVEQSTDKVDLLASQCFASKVWNTAAGIMDKRKPEGWQKLDVSEHCFFHNYDHMEVWG